MKQDFQNLSLEKIFSFIFSFWREILLSLFFVFAVLFLINPDKTTYFTSWLLLSLAFVGIAFLWKREIKKKKNKVYKTEEVVARSFLLNDKEIFDASSDRLDLKEDIENFANLVLGNGDDNPVIFGLDAPWGSGKSSYLNLCRSLVWDKAGSKPIVFRFDPIIFDASKQDIPAVFIEQLTKTLEKEGVSVEYLRSDFTKLFRSIKGVTIGGVSFDLFSSKSSVEEILNNIREHLKLIPRKIIIIVDDLDRLYLEDIKAILGIIRNVFYTENVTFILCYDSNSINTFETQYKIVHKSTFNGAPDPKSLNKKEYTRSEVDLDNRKINAYLEKFVQVKKSLIPSRGQLLGLFRALIRDIDKDADNPALKELEDGITSLFDPESYWRYQPLIGDIRKIKRVFNFLCSASLIGIRDFNERDIDVSTLLKLVLIYVNHPHIFQKIYNAETGGSRGFFSVVTSLSLDRQDDRYKNSNQFFEYLKSLSEEEAFLLHELFCFQCAKGNCKRKEWSPNGFVKNLAEEEDFERKSPMFNGGDFAHTNLEDYLKIIQNHRLLPRNVYHAFHSNRLKELESKTVKEIFESTEEYSTKYGERPREQFFVAAQNKETNPVAINKVIEYIVKEIHHYSMVNGFSGVYDGLRDGLAYRLLWILDIRGWQDEDGESFGNDDEHIKPIAVRLLEKEVSLGKSIVDALLDVSHYPTFAVLDVIRLSSSVISSSSVFNVRRSVDIYAKEKNINLHEFFAQKVFSFFRESYIDKGVNFIKDLDEVDNAVLLGDFPQAIEEWFISQGESLEEEILKIKSSAVSGIIYRFSQAPEDPKFMGAYTDTANPERRISEIMREYLFGVCFNVDADITNATYFVNYALASYDNVVHRSIKWKLDINNSLEKVCGERLLKDYWQKNRDKIVRYAKALPQDTKVFTYNYSATYQDDLDDLFKNLDQYCLPTQQESKKVT